MLRDAGCWLLDAAELTVSVESFRYDRSFRGCVWWLAAHPAIYLYFTCALPRKTRKHSREATRAPEAADNVWRCAVCLERSELISNPVWMLDRHSAPEHGLSVDVLSLQKKSAVKVDSLVQSLLVKCFYEFLKYSTKINALE